MIKNICKRQYSVLIILSFFSLFIFIDPVFSQTETNMGDTTSSEISTKPEIKPNPDKSSKRNFFQRMLGKSATKPPEDESCWEYSDGLITVDLIKASELSESDGSISLEGKNLPDRILVIRGDDNDYHAFKNSCAHGKRRLDPVPGAGTVQCCSMGKSTYDYHGKRLAGAAKDDIVIYDVKVEDSKLVIVLK
ncbi:MAG: Rieske 2Fe-2S domain-containing protein [Candidatus Electryonea clarkiae]|nr:Rieske 2Fe-2S domain-containing protein [Candidatus Electryonea clarkiae]MDP8286888.1 Rieske 2Fe-2S domain-containing protein [Candidatus Electryonea clarkiae]